MQKSWGSFGRIGRLKPYRGGEKGALFSVFLNWCCGHKGLCTPFLVQGGKYGLSTSPPTFAWSLAPDDDVEGGREAASGKRTAGWGVSRSSLRVTVSPKTQAPTKCSPPSAPTPFTVFSYPWVLSGPNDGFHLSREIWSASSCPTEVPALPCHVPGLSNLQAPLRSAESWAQINI